MPPGAATFAGLLLWGLAGAAACEHLGFQHHSALSAGSWSGGRGRAISAQPGGRLEMVGGGHMGFRLTGLALSVGQPSAPTVLSQEGQVVAGILQLALAAEKCANHPGMEIPCALWLRECRLTREASCRTSLSLALSPVGGGWTAGRDTSYCTGSVPLPRAEI